MANKVNMTNLFDVAYSDIINNKQQLYSTLKTIEPAYSGLTEEQQLLLDWYVKTINKNFDWVKNSLNIKMISNEYLSWVYLWLAIYYFEKNDIQMVMFNISMSQQYCDYVDHKTRAFIEAEIQLLKAEIMIYYQKYNDAIQNLQSLVHSKFIKVAQNAENWVNPLTINQKIGNYVFSSPCTLAILKRFREILFEREQNIFIYGQPGTGKTQLATVYRNLYNQLYNIRTENEIVALTKTEKSLISAELFGTTKGSFTDACNNPGIFEKYNNGVIIIDEVGDIPLDAQASLLQILQERTYKPIGGNGAKIFSGTIICITNKNLQECVANNTFRDDLLSRLKRNSVIMPPLNDRKEEIPFIANSMIANYCNKYDISIEINEEVFKCLMAYSYDNNIRDLENLLLNTLPSLIQTSKNGDVPKLTARMIGEARNRMVPIECDANYAKYFPIPTIPIENPFSHKLLLKSITNQPRQFSSAIDEAGSTYLSYLMSDANNQPTKLVECRNDLEKNLIEWAYNKYKCNVKLAAQYLGISMSLFYEKMKTYRLST